MRSDVRALVAVVCVCAAAACSGSDTAVDPTVMVFETVVVPATTLADRSPAETIETLPRPMTGVDIALSAESLGLEAELGADIDPEALQSSDPFGTFGSCSGVRRAFGPYSVWVSDPAGEVVAAAVATSESVTSDGIHDADLRLELDSGDIVSAAGTMTIDAGWRSGSFVAFTAEGGSVTGTFTCSGGDPDPRPLSIDDVPDQLDSVEVVALLRDGQSERVVDLAVDLLRSPATDVECPGSIGQQGEYVVRVDGGQTLGAITTFELTGGERPTIRLRVGGTSYVSEDVDLVLADPASSGTFSATADGVSVDGAFRCT